MGFLGILAIVFIILKLCNLIVWSWYLVLMPVFIYFAWMIILFVFIFIAAYYQVKHEDESMVSRYLRKYGRK